MKNHYEGKQYNITGTIVSRMSWYPPPPPKTGFTFKNLVDPLYLMILQYQFSQVVYSVYIITQAWVGTPLCIKVQLHIPFHFWRQRDT